MPHAGDSFGAQLRRNAVALISLFIAVSSLSYNTWRNEKTEANRNERVAAFEILLKLGDLQQLVFHHHYDGDTQDKGNPRTGWTYALAIRDLSRVLPAKYHVTTDQLLEIWGTNWDQLEDNKDSVDRVLNAVEHTRGEMLELLKSLE